MAYYVKDEENRKKLEDTLTELVCTMAKAPDNSTDEGLIKRIREVEKALDWTDGTKRVSPEKTLNCPLIDFMDVDESGGDVFITFNTNPHVDEGCSENAETGKTEQDYDRSHYNTEPRDDKGDDVCEETKDALYGELKKVVRE